MCVTDRSHFPRCFWNRVIVNPLEATLPRALCLIFITPRTMAHMLRGSAPLISSPRCFRAGPSCVVIRLSQERSRKNDGSAFFTNFYLKSAYHVRSSSKRRYYVLYLLLPHCKSKCVIFTYLD